MSSPSVLKINQKVTINVTNQSYVIIKEFNTFLYSILQFPNGAVQLRTWHGTLDVTEACSLFPEHSMNPRMITSDSTEITIEYVDG